MPHEWSAYCLQIGAGNGSNSWTVLTRYATQDQVVQTLVALREDRALYFNSITIISEEAFDLMEPQYSSRGATYLVIYGEE